MATYRQIFYQIVFGTRDRKPTIRNAFETELYKYTYGIIKNHNCKLHRINGMEDHIHIMSDLHPSVCLSDYVKYIKVSTSLCMKESVSSPPLRDGRKGMEHSRISSRKRTR